VGVTAAASPGVETAAATKKTYDHAWRPIHRQFAAAGPPLQIMLETFVCLWEVFEMDVKGRTPWVDGAMETITGMPVTP
jgi:hypothetical protein